MNQRDTSPSPGRRPHIVALGDAVVDVVVETGRPVLVDDDIPARTTLDVGGQAANVAGWAAYLGGSATVVTALGDDPAGRLVRDQLGARGVTVRAATSHAPTGTVVSLVTSDGRRSLLSDRGAAGTLRGGQLAADWFAGATWLHLSGYALLGADDPEAALAAASLARQAGARVSVDLSAATVVAGRGAERSRALLRAVRAELVFGNELEFQTLGTLDVAAGVIKLGPAGHRLVSVDGVVHAPAPPVTVRDTTGAGDAFAAGWLVGGAELAADAAAECVSQPGAGPPPRR